MEEVSQELVVAAPSQVGYVVDPNVDETGLSDVARLKPTGLSLVQNTTRDSKGARPGQILDLLTGQAYDSLVVVPMRVQRSRVMFPPGADLDAEPVCLSNNGLTPSTFAKVPQSHNCKTCSKAQWFDRQKPPCQEKRRLLLIVKETGLPRTFTVGGASLAPFQEMIDRIGQDVYISKRAGKTFNLYDYFFTISSVKKTSSKGGYYVAQFSDVTRVQSPGEFGPLFEQFVLAAKQYAAEQEAVAGEAKVDEAVGEVVDAEYVEV